MSFPPRNTETAEEIAINALGFIASDPVLLNRFLAITGIEASDIRYAAKQPGFLAGVLQFIVAHEPTLIAFSESASVPPAEIVKALRSLPLGNDDYERST
ncbi:MAG: DUF3572 domain-containing protein [Mesorhizobium sp.]